MTWATWLLGLVGPIVTRVMLALGIGYLTFNGAQGLMIAALENVATSFGGLAAEATAILARCGFFLAMSIMCGGLMGGVSYYFAKRIGVLSETTTTNS